MKSVEAVNYSQKRKLFEKISNHFEGELSGKVFAIWGLSFKPNTDDMREAPSRVLMEALWDAGAMVQAYDPVAMDECQRIYGQRDELMLTGTAEAALKNADALVIVTEWQQFRAPDFDFIVKSLNHPVLFDGRNIFDPERLKARGVIYYSIGRGQ
jgi:UDPglucose 6-dehydrogenase